MEKKKMIPLKNNIPLSWNIIALISFWYLFSFSTLTFNKYIVSSLQGDPILLGKSERTVKIEMFNCGLLKLLITINSKVDD